MAEEAVMTNIMDNVSSMSNDDIDAELARAGEESLQPEPDDAGVSEELSPEDAATQEDSQEKEEVTLESLQKQLEEANKRYDNLQSLNGRQSQELGELRKFQKEQLAKQQEKPDVEETNPDEFIDKFVKNPQEQVVQMLQRQLEKQKAAQQQEQLEQQERYRNNFEYVKQQVPEIQNLRQGILDVAKEMGENDVQDHMIDSAIVNNPYLVAAYGKIAQLKSQLANASNKGSEMLKKVANASKRTSTVSAKSGKASTSAVNTFSGEPASLDDSALAKLLAEAMANE